MEGEMLVTLYLWTVVAAASSTGRVAYSDWREMGQFENVALCEKAKKQLGIPDTNGRCVVNKEAK